MKLIINLEEFERLFDKYPIKEVLVDKLKELGYVFGGKEDKDFVRVFSQIYTAYRKKTYFKGVKHYTESSKAYGIVTAIAEEAMVFIHQFNLDMREGFIQFLEIAKENNWLSLRALNQHKHLVGDKFDISNEVLSDPLEDTTYKIHEEFLIQMGLRFGLFEKFDDPHEYVHFVRASKLCKKFNYQPREFVVYLFEAWEWTSSPLTPSQLYSRKAEEYLFKGQGSSGVSVRPLVKKVKIRKGFERWE